MWISDAGQWPPRVVPAEFAADLFSLLDDRWIDLDDWRNPRWSDFEYDCAIQLWRPQKEKKKPPKRRKGQPPEPVSLLVHTFYV